MSEISVLSNQYDKLVVTSDKINDSVIILKKTSLLKDRQHGTKYPKLTVSKEEFFGAKENLLPFLESINNILDDTGNGSEFIPDLILEDYKQRLSSFPFIQEEITNLTKKLNQDVTIGIEDIKVLDEILKVLDTERSTLFRKLRTARG